MTDRDPALADLAAMWRAIDPVPPTLFDKVLVAVATESLDAEYELLHLVERSRDLAGARGAADAVTISFSTGEFSLLLRVSAAAAGQRRVDGWVSPPQPMQVTATQQERSVSAVADALGRFEIPRLPSGLTRFWLVSENRSDSAEQSFATPTFEL
jgi:hypothetical protein